MCHLSKFSGSLLALTFSYTSHPFLLQSLSPKPLKCIECSYYFLCICHYHSSLNQSSLACNNVLAPTRPLCFHPNSPTVYPAPLLEVNYLLPEGRGKGTGAHTQTHRQQPQPEAKGNRKPNLSGLSKNLLISCSNFRSRREGQKACQRCPPQNVT